jgi:phosphoribosylaminoimidazole carboxylase PurE protein
MTEQVTGFVSIIIGSQSDKDVAKKVTDILENFEIKFEIKVISAHRLPDVLAEYVKNLRRRGCKVVIGIAGMSAALPGCIAAHTLLPVIGVPVGGEDALHSIVQMPKGVPVACMAINGGINAALFAIRIISVENDDIRGRLITWKGAMQRKCKEEIDVLRVL